MSHFTVAVISDHPDQIDSLLAPYQENNASNCPEEYIKFIDVTEEKRKEWETEGCQEWYADIRHVIRKNNIEERLKEIKEDGQYTFLFDELFYMNRINNGATVCISGHVNGESGKENYREIFGRIESFRQLSPEEIWEEMDFGARKRWRENYEDREEFLESLNKKKELQITVSVIDGPREISYKEQYPDFDKFMTEHHEYQKDEKTGKYGYYENPNAKWDWWQVGGRWMGSLLIKEDKEGFVGNPGTFGNSAPNTPNGYIWVDSCFIKDVEWEKMAQIKKFELLSKEGEDGDIWDILTGKANVPERKRMEYTWYKPEYFIEKFGNKENYIKSQISFGTYAVITPDGKWYAPGDMGWWGISSDSHEEANEFQDKFHENFIEKYPDKIITIVDCHI